MRVGVGQTELKIMKKSGVKDNPKLCGLGKWVENEGAIT